MAEELKSPHGREKEPEGDDPMELVMTPLPGGDPVFMARCLIEEYARMGMGEQEILNLFSLPAYQIHALYRERGEAWVRDLIAEVMTETGQMHVSVKYFHHLSVNKSAASKETGFDAEHPSTGYRDHQKQRTSNRRAIKGGCDD